MPSRQPSPTCRRTRPNPPSPIRPRRPRRRGPRPPRAVDGQALGQAVERLLVAAVQLVDDAKVGQGAGQTIAVAQLPADREALAQAGDRLIGPSQQPVDDAQVGEARGLALPVAQLPEAGQALVQGVERLRIPSQPGVGAGEVAVALPVPAAGGELQHGLVGPDAVLPVAVPLEEPEQRPGELGGQLGRDRGRRHGDLADRRQQVRPLRLEPGQRRRRVRELETVAGPARVGAGQPVVGGPQQRQRVPGGGGVVAEQAGERREPLGFGMPAGGVLAGVQAHQVVELVAARSGRLQQPRVDQALEQPLGDRLWLVEQPGGGRGAEIRTVGEAEQPEGARGGAVDLLRALLKVGDPRGLQAERAEQMPQPFQRLQPLGWRRAGSGTAARRERRRRAGWRPGSRARICRSRPSRRSR
jgi:hypothetical protein